MQVPVAVARADRRPAAAGRGPARSRDRSRGGPSQVRLLDPVAAFPRRRRRRRVVAAVYWAVVHGHRQRRDDRVVGGAMPVDVVVARRAVRSGRRDVTAAS